ncbi:ABC transporter substrate-binding protein [Microbacterium sp. NPDC058342]|uniref:ABC transporter substrate-binding protein n=1 Tax=Microbacterium sp. NPDC058342 TaxID=3346454 RepID=UPI00365E3E95
MRSTKFGITVLAGGVALALLLSSCSSASPDSDTSMGSSIATFDLGVREIPMTLDVAQNYDPQIMAIAGAVNQPLEIPNLDGTFTSVLAEAVSQPDELTLVYDLRDDAIFSDGAPLTAEDVVWSIERLRQPDTHTAAEVASIAGVAATGPHQVTVTMAHPAPGLRGSLALISFVHQAKYGTEAGAALGTSEAPPIGTGPYVVDTYTADSLTLARNPEFTGEPPAIETLNVVAIADDNAAQLAMRSGELDGIQVDDIKSAPQWESIEGVVAHSSAALWVDCITMDTSKAPFDDVHVRRAVAYATDAAGLLAANYGDFAVLSPGVIAPEVVASIEPESGALDAVIADSARYDFNLERAREELALSAHPDGFSAEFVSWSPAGDIVAQSLTQNLGEIGIELTVKNRTFGEFGGDMVAGNDPAIAFFRLAATVPDPSSWYGIATNPEDPFNPANFDNDAATAAFAKVQTSEPATRWEGVAELIRIFTDEVPYVPLAQPDYVFATAPGVTFTQDPDFIQMASGAWIETVRAAG